MKSGGWRALLLGLCAIVAIAAAIEAFVEFGGPDTTSYVGQWGDTVGASSRPFHLTVISIDPGHGADLAGVRRGDLIDIRPNSPVERFWLFGQPPTGHPVTLTVLRGGQQLKRTIVPQSAQQFRVLLLLPAWLGFIWIALFGAIIAWRRSGDPQMRMLCLLLVSYGLWETTNSHYITSQSSWVLAGAGAVNALGTLAVAFWAACAARFGSSISPARYWVGRVCYVFVGVSAAFGILKVFGILTLSVDPVAFISRYGSLPFIVAYSAATVCAIFAVSATQGAERQRAIWSLMPGGALIFVGFGSEAMQGITSSYELAWGAYYIAAAVNMITPLLLTYVALNRRLLDIGFVLNRAAVFAIVSTLLIAVFVLVEWIANEWLSGSHTTSAVVSMFVALVLGLSIRYVHRFVDQFVDTVLFRKRHEQEAALRRHAHEAAFITDRNTLIERTIASVQQATGADASILLLNDARAGVDENDPALVALRAWNKRIDLESYPESALKGQFAFPMIGRGEVLGALICGSKKDSEVYAPDESAALQLVATAVGTALLLQREDGAGSLTAMISELRAAIQDLRTMKT